MVNVVWMAIIPATHGQAAMACPLLAGRPDGQRGYNTLKLRTGEDGSDTYIAPPGAHLVITD
jgi:hypothetical protein